MASLTFNRTQNSRAFDVSEVRDFEHLQTLESLTLQLQGLDKTFAN